MLRKKNNDPARYIFGLRIGGDEELSGPLYNYARPYTWCRISRTVLEEVRGTFAAEGINGNANGNANGHFQLVHGNDDIQPPHHFDANIS